MYYFFLMPILLLNLNILIFLFISWNFLKHTWTHF